jgi:hypothetical protein
MNRRIILGTRLILGAAVCGVGLALGPAALAAPGSDSQTRRLDKQISLFEFILDDMLVESPNLLVHSREAATGIHLEGKGAMFTFKVGLNTFNWDSDDDHWWKRIWSSGSEVIILTDDGDRVEDIEKWRDEQLPKQEKLYQAGKEEIQETILNFAEVLTALEDDEWVVIKARLRGTDYFREQDIRKLEIKVQMKDIRAFAAGRLDEAEAMRKFQVTES